MSWWKKVLGVATGGIYGQSLFGGGDDKKKKDPYEDLINAIKPILDQQMKTSSELSGFGKEDLAATRNQYNDLIGHFQKIMSGSRDEVLGNEDLSAITNDYDNAEKQLTDYGVRGGKRAETLASLPFEKAAEINRLVQALRKEAPDKLFQLAQAMGQLGTNEYSIALNNQGSILNSQFNLQGLKDTRYENEQARKAAIISSILGTVGNVAGAIAGGA